MKKIVTSLGVVVFVGALVVAGTGAFFSDTETSKANTFTAGAIDLTVDSEQHYNDMVCANVNGFGSPYVWIPNNANPGDFDAADAVAFNLANPLNYPPAGTACDGSWVAANLGAQTFFNFSDVKPGDEGENTISLHVDSNDAYACVDVSIISNDDVSSTEPETEAGDAVEDGGNKFDGELAQNLTFFAWADDGAVDGFGDEGDTTEGDNIWQAGELPLFSNIVGSSSDALDGESYTLADSGTGPLEGGVTSYIGLAWCAGTFTVVGPGVLECDGESMGNLAQTDEMTADISFRIEQARHNEQFSCDDDVVEPPVGPTVGAALGAYVAPVCTVTVADGASIQAAIDANGPGSTICVAPGTHDSDTYPLRVNEDNMSLVSTGGAATTILNGGVILDNDGTKVMGFTLTSSTALSETFGVYINTGVDNAVVSFNDMNGPGVGTGRGVVNAFGTTNNALIANNEISNYLTGVFLNSSSNMIVEKNDLVANGVGSGNDNPTANIIRNNQITGNTIEGVGVFAGGAESIDVNFNNIFGNGTEDELNSYGANVVDAENNWWGDADPTGDTSGPVDATPAAAAAYAQN